MALFLREADVEALLAVPEAMAAVLEAMRDLALGRAANEPRRRVRAPGFTLHLMGATWAARGYGGYKAYRTTASGTHFRVHLFRVPSGEALATIEADRLGQVRTGAASGVATRLLARDDARTLAVIGAGWQARSQVAAVAAARPLVEVRVFARRAEGREAFAREVAPLLDGVRVLPADSAEAAVRGADVVVTATTAREPVLRGEWLEPGVHVNAIGANDLARRELDEEAVRRAARIVVDSRDQAAVESGDLVHARERGLLAWDRVQELAPLCAGLLRGRTERDEITLFRSHGIALWDIAAAAIVYEKARAAGFGVEALA